MVSAIKYQNYLDFMQRQVVTNPIFLQFHRIDHGDGRLEHQCDSIQTDIVTPEVTMQKVPAILFKRYGVAEYIVVFHSILRPQAEVFVFPNHISLSRDVPDDLATEIAAWEIWCLFIRNLPKSQASTNSVK